MGNKITKEGKYIIKIIAQIYKNIFKLIKLDNLKNTSYFILKKYTLNEKYLPLLSTFFYIQKGLSQ